MSFDPEPDHSLNFNNRFFRYVEHPKAPGMVHSQEGKRALVFHLELEKEHYALKVFKSSFQTPDTARNASALSNLKKSHPEMTGLTVADRLVIDPSLEKKLTSQFSELTYAVLMPWVNGKLWFEYASKGIELTREQSFLLASNLAQTLYGLESRGLAHCDVSSSNFIFTQDFKEVELVDIEELFAPGWPPPKIKPSGSDGYAPKWLDGDKLWGPCADRFATAILLAEILTWHNVNIRNSKSGESYFSSAEMGTKCSRYDLMWSYLDSINPEIANRFNTAWFAQELEQCPKIEEWYQIIKSLNLILPSSPVPSYGSAIGELGSLDDEDEKVAQHKRADQRDTDLSANIARALPQPSISRQQSTPVIPSKEMVIKAKTWGGLTLKQFIGLMVGLPALMIVLSFILLPYLYRTWVWGTVAIPALLGPIAYITFRKQWLSILVIAPTVYLGGIANQSQLGWGELTAQNFLVAGLLGGIVFETVLWIGNKKDASQFKPVWLELIICLVGGLLSTITIYQFLFGSRSWERPDFIFINLFVSLLGWLIGLYFYNVIVLIREKSKRST